MNEGSSPTMTTLTSWMHDRNMFRGIQALKEEGLLFDCTLIAEGESIPAHKMVMAACSEYFRIMFTGDLKESKENQVELKGISAISVRSLVDFAYTGELKLCMENVEDVVTAANYFQMGDAVDVCGDYLEQKRTYKNVVEILNLAETNMLEKILKKTEEFLEFRFTDIPLEILLKLSTKQLVRLIGRNSLTLKSEYQLFEKLISLIKAKPDETEESIFELLSKVRFPLMTEEQLSRVAEEEIFSSYPKCHDLLCEAQEYHKDVLKQPMMQTERTQVRNFRESFLVSSSCETLRIISKYQDYRNYKSLKSFVVCGSRNTSFEEVAVIDNFLYAAVLLHFRKPGKLALFLRYDPRFDVWKKLSKPSLKWESSLVFAPYKREIYAIDSGDENTVDLEVFSIQFNKWEKKSPLSSRNRSFAGVAFKDKIYISGGEDSGKVETEVYCYSPSSDTWESKAPMIQARKSHKMAEITGRLYAFGGNDLNSVEYYHSDVDQWTLCTKTLNFKPYGLVQSDKDVYIIRMELSYDDDSCADDTDEIIFELYDPVTESMGYPGADSAFTFYPDHKLVSAYLILTDHTTYAVYFDTDNESMENDFDEDTRPLRKYSNIDKIMITPDISDSDSDTDKKSSVKALESSESGSDTEKKSSESGFDTEKKSSESETDTEKKSSESETDTEKKSSESETDTEKKSPESGTDTHNNIFGTDSDSDIKSPESGSDTEKMSSGSASDTHNKIFRTDSDSDVKSPESGSCTHNKSIGTDSDSDVKSAVTGPDTDTKSAEHHSDANRRSSGDDSGQDLDMFMS